MKRNAIHSFVFKSFLLILLINYLWRMVVSPNFLFFSDFNNTCGDLLFPHINTTAQNIFKSVGTVLNFTRIIFPAGNIEKVATCRYRFFPTIRQLQRTTTKIARSASSLESKPSSTTRLPDITVSISFKD